MVNLSFKPSDPPRGYCSGFKNYVEKTDSSGCSVLVECSDPYEGLSAESFSLQAQIDAGVPLQHVSPVPTSSLSSVDRNNVQAELFVKNFSKPQVPQLNE